LYLYHVKMSYYIAFFMCLQDEDRSPDIYPRVTRYEDKDKNIKEESILEVYTMEKQYTFKNMGYYDFECTSAGSSEDSTTCCYTWLELKHIVELFSGRT